MSCDSAGEVFPRPFFYPHPNLTVLMSPLVEAWFIPPWVHHHPNLTVLLSPLVGAWFIPALAAAGYLLCILSAVGRTGINPVPTADVCNTLAINGLSSLLQHSATVGAGFIPALAAAWYLHQFLLVADRTGINPVPTADVCNTLAINGLSRNCSNLPP